MNHSMQFEVKGPLLFLGLLLGSFATSAQTPTSLNAGSISGVVVDAANGKPLAQAKVVLSNLRPGQSPREAVTNERGAFAFEGVPASDFPYFIKAERDGYKQQTASGRIDDSNFRATGSSIPMNIGPRVRATLELRLTQTAVIAGRISDLERRPVASANVELMVANPGGADFSATPKAVTTDAEGKYRIDGIMPGEYVIRASAARSVPRVDPYGKLTSVVVTDPLSSSFYPGVPSVGLAAKVTVTPGSEFHAGDVQLAPPSPFRISGRIVNPLTFDSESDAAVANHARLHGQRGLDVSQGFGIDAAGAYTLYLIPTDKPEEEQSAIGPLPDYDDDVYRFELRNVPAGSYELNAIFRPTTGDGFKWYPYVGRGFVRVGDRAVENLEVHIERNADVSGRIVRHDSVPSRLDLSTLLPTLDSADRVPDTLHVNPWLAMIRSVEKDGSFHIPVGVPPGRYRVGMAESQLPEGVYLDTARTEDGTNLLGVPFTVGAGGSYRMVLELRGDGGRIEGAVSDRDRREVGNVSVLLVPPDNRRNDPGAYRVTTTNAKGQFSIDGIRPDSYTLLGFNGMIEDSLSRDAAFVARYVNIGRKLEIKKNQTIRANLEAIAR